MAGTKEGAAKAARTNKQKYGKDFYARIGAEDGRNGHTGGFAAGEAGRERAKTAGKLGGQRSKRGKLLINGEYFPTPPPDEKEEEVPAPTVSLIGRVRRVFVHES